MVRKLNNWDRESDIDSLDFQPSKLNATKLKFYYKILKIDEFRKLRKILIQKKTLIWGLKIKPSQNSHFWRKIALIWDFNNRNTSSKMHFLLIFNYYQLLVQMKWLKCILSALIKTCFINNFSDPDSVKILDYQK